ncbi:hypothetical protein GJAV_G00147060 [Gymnothorax javanicus]|nr:hypothetical protein GJAV_G00147060 [Gymnothorax javanicus]
MTAGSIFVPQIIPIRVPQPGKAKHHIDTSTPVEIKSDSKDVTIFYTVDGSKPVPVRRPGYGENTTAKYSGPVYLPEGKVSVRAIAVSSDGRESAIVTKLFMVDYIHTENSESTEDNEENFLKQFARDMANQDSAGGSSPFLNLSGSLRSAWGDTTERFQGMKIQGSDSLRPPKGPRFTNSRFGAPFPKPKHSSSLASHHAQGLNEAQGDGLWRSLTKTDISRILREADSLRCPQCLSPRPSDPYARFCPQCGTPVPPLPEQSLPPTEGAQMRLCVHCKMMVPPGALFCAVCEAPVAPQLQPQASLQFKDKVICPSCGVGNPVNLTYCANCETRLPEPSLATLGGERAPPLPDSERRMLFCSNCSRVNISDARYCDWCGAKPGHSGSHLTCSRCGASSERYASYCGSCGMFLEPPARPGTSPSHTVERATLVERSSLHPSGVTWLPVPLLNPPPLPPPPSSDKHTQTVGLFYPSATELNKKSLQAALELSRQEHSRDHRPLITPISPGRGYWRKQLDHICAHLRSYAQNNSEFRALIGEPRMGKMISAFVEEDNSEVNIRISFVSAGSDSSKGGEREKSAGRSELLPVSTEMDGPAGQSAVGENSSPSGESRKNKKERKNRAQEEETLLHSKDAQLLAEVGPRGQGRVAVVQQLLDEGADPCCQGFDGRPVLTVAVMNLHHELIPLLVQNGADINQQSGPVSNSALHEAAALGSQALQCAETLLSCNASIRQRNDRGLTAYDLAVRSGCSSLMSLIAARTGQGLLDKLARPRNTVTLDTF